MINNKTPPIAMPIIAAEDSAGESIRVTRSEPIVKVRTFYWLVEKSMKRLLFSNKYTG